MHPLASVALALVLIAARPAQAQAEAQAPAPPGFLDAAAVVEGLVVDMRYFGDDNFVGARIDGYERARCLLSAPAARALAVVARDLAARGLGLKVFDCYRPQRAVAHFLRWAQRIDDIKNKPEFYPDVPKRDLFQQGYISERSAHSRGSTVDLTLARRADARELDMGSPFDFFSPKSWPSDTSVSAQAQKNRALLAAAMMRGGFRPYDKEWWHYTLADEPFPDTCSPALVQFEGLASAPYRWFLRAMRGGRAGEDSIDALHCSHRIGFCIRGACPRRKQRSQSRPPSRRTGHAEAGGREGRAGDRQSASLLARHGLSPQ